MYLQNSLSYTATMAEIVVRVAQVSWWAMLGLILWMVYVQFLRAKSNSATTDILLAKLVVGVSIILISNILLYVGAWIVWANTNPWLSEYRMLYANGELINEIDSIQSIFYMHIARTLNLSVFYIIIVLIIRTQVSSIVTSILVIVALSIGSYSQTKRFAVLPHISVENQQSSFNKANAINFNELYDELYEKVSYIQHEEGFFTIFLDFDDYFKANNSDENVIIKDVIEIMENKLDFAGLTHMVMANIDERFNRYDFNHGCVSVQKNSYTAQLWPYMYDSWKYPSNRDTVSIVVDYNVVEEPFKSIDNRVKSDTFYLKEIGGAHSFMIYVQMQASRHVEVVLEIVDDNVAKVNVYVGFNTALKQPLDLEQSQMISNALYEIGVSNTEFVIDKINSIITRSDAKDESGTLDSYAYELLIDYVYDLDIRYLTKYPISYLKFSIEK
ncbi:MAG: hypothetical protein BEN18_04940 [Epulopiscium sp. Nuni2H_MBin001]|nr:MAG: hypothetical protein BEN18_04940 [Epulopiscium sp. Nuni2H_MBin001]